MSLPTSAWASNDDIRSPLNASLGFKFEMLVFHPPGDDICDLDVIAKRTGREPNVLAVMLESRQPSSRGSGLRIRRHVM